MKKYLFGILLLFVFLQPLTAKDLVYHSAPPFGERPCAFLSANTPQSPKTQMEAVLVDVDDEDEVSETETKTNISEFVFETQTQISITPKVHQIVGTSVGTSSCSIANQPLYLLWSVFRI